MYLKPIKCKINKAIYNYLREINKEILLEETPAFQLLTMLPYSL